MHAFLIDWYINKILYNSEIKSIGCSKLNKLASSTENHITYPRVQLKCFLNMTKNSSKYIYDQDQLLLLPIPYWWGRSGDETYALIVVRRDIDVVLLVVARTKGSRDSVEERIFAVFKFGILRLIIGQGLMVFGVARYLMFPNTLFLCF